MRNRYILRKQMTTDASRLMRLSAAAPMEQQCLSAAFQYCQVVQLNRCAAGRLACLGSRRWPYEGLSRMKGNFHVRFSEGGGLVTARLYSANVKREA